jgi:hypothetical protein
MSRRYCAGCPGLRAKVGGQDELPWCKHVRLCREVDPSLIDRYPGETIAQLKHRAQAIELAHVRTCARASGWQGSRFPGTAASSGA